MDYRIFPGLPYKKDRILHYAKKYLSVDEKIEGRRTDIVACKVVIVLLAMDLFKNRETLTEIGSIIGADHSRVVHYRKSYQHLYQGKSDFYHFVYVNLKNNILGLKYYRIEDFMDECRSLLPRNGEKATNDAFLAWFFMNQVSLREAYKFLGKEYSPVNLRKTINFKNKKAELDLISQVAKDMTGQALTNQIKYYAERKVDLRE